MFTFYYFLKNSRVFGQCRNSHRVKVFPGCRWMAELMLRLFKVMPDKLDLEAEGISRKQNASVPLSFCNFSQLQLNAVVTDFKCYILKGIVYIRSKSQVTRFQTCWTSCVPVLLQSTCDHLANIL